MGRVGRIGKWFGAILHVLVDKLCRKDLNMRFCLNTSVTFYVVFCGRGGLHCDKKGEKKKKKKTIDSTSIISGSSSGVPFYQ